MHSDVMAELADEFDDLEDLSDREDYELKTTDSILVTGKSDDVG